MKNLRIFVAIATFMVLVGGFIVGTKIICTSFALMGYSLDISSLEAKYASYTAPGMKTPSNITDQIQDDIAKLTDERREKYYESDDSLIRSFSNSNAGVKALWIAISLISVSLPILYIIAIYSTYIDYMAIKSRMKRERYRRLSLQKIIDEEANKEVQEMLNKYK